LIDDDFVKMIKQLQKKIEYEEEKIYSKIVINEYRNPTYFGVIKNPDAIGKIKGPCGDTVKFSLKIKNEVITDANFWTDGCGATLASGNMLIKIIIGKKIRDANKITAKDLLDALDGLPKENHHCAVLAINTLRKSIKNYQNKK
jgi:nitrogen fixation NifU-like protein